MNERYYITLVLIGIAVSGVAPAIAQTTLETDTGAAVAKPSTDALAPASDPKNEGGWVLREDISDDFEGDALDPSKWFIQGENEDYYIWKGRAPSQFAPHNVIVEDGKLKLRSQWEPDYKFAEGEGHEGNTYRTHEGKDVPVTTAGVITRKRFLNGYMEVKSKAGDAPMTSSFWMIGYESELDVYEQMGKPKAKGDIQEDTFKCSVHDWSPPAKRPTRRFGNKQKLPFRVADDFHIYGCDWGEDYLKCYVDGELVYETTQEEVGKDWVLTNPLEVWLDSEIFVWLGWPAKEDLPVDFEIEYMRVWQKPTNNLIARAFFGFEGPILFQENPRPLTLVPENSENNDYQKFWSIDEASAKHLSIVRHEKFAAGTRSLKFVQEGESAVNSVTAVAPNGSVRLPAGELVLSMSVLVEPESDAKSLTISLGDGGSPIEPIDLPSCEPGEWVTFDRPFTKGQPSSESDHLTVEFDLVESGGSSTVFVDNITIRKADDQ